MSARGPGLQRAVIALIALFLLCWLIVASAEPITVDPMRVYVVRQVIAAPDALTAALIACGPDHASVVCDVAEVSQ